jgi:glycosyltransferase involved in cell wall biosynthesis
MRRVGFVIVNLCGGGAERVVLNIAKLFSQNNVDVHLFLLENFIAHELPDIKIHTLEEKRKKNKIFKNHGNKVLGQKLQNMILDIERDGSSFDLIFSNLPAADRIVSTLSIQRNIFYVMHTTYTLEIEEMRHRKEYLRAYRRTKNYQKLYKNKSLISVSQGIAEDMDILGVQYRSNTVIYNPFDIEEIRNKGAQIPQDLPKEKYIIHVAAYRKEKRHDILLEAYAKLKDAPKLILMCDYNQELEKLIKKNRLEGKVIIFGFKKNPYPYMKHAELLVHSSEREGLPTVLIESFILGTPVVSTNCKSGPSEILTGEHAKYLSNVNDSNDLAEKISLALKDLPNITDNMVDKFKKEQIFSEYIALYNEIKRSK